MKLSPVDSRSIVAAGYDPEMEVFRVRFVSGGTYDYLDVPKAVFRGFEAADSKGRYVNFVVKPRYRYRRIR